MVFVIRKDILDEFREATGNRLEKLVDVEYVFQELDDLPEGYEKPAERTKPWGTGQAILCCKNAVNTPFVVINADDYYGVDTYRIMYEHLEKQSAENSDPGEICMMGFKLGNTLSDNGGVTRGICVVDSSNRLLKIDETKNIEKCERGGIVKNASGERIIDPDTPVSMNMWGFNPGFIDLLDDGFKNFLDKTEDNISGEFLLPIYIDELLKAGKASVQVLETSAKWFGVTYQEDRQYVQDAFKELVGNGVYSNNLYA